MMSDRQSLDMAWLIPDGIYAAGVCARPFSLGSLLIVDALSIKFGESDFQSRVESASRFMWSHSEPLEQVLWAIHSGGWRTVLDAWEFEHDAEQWVEDVEAHIERISPLIEAAQVEIARRPGKGGDEDRPPVGFVEPHWLANYVAAISQAIRAGEREIIWSMPLARALQYHHSALRLNDNWTVAPSSQESSRVSEDDLAALCDDFIDGVEDHLDRDAAGDALTLSLFDDLDELA